MPEECEPEDTALGCPEGPVGSSGLRVRPGGGAALLRQVVPGPTGVLPVHTFGKGAAANQSLSPPRSQR